MIIRTPELRIDPKNPFQSDRLGRLESAELLSAFVEHASAPYVLAIDAKWGNGKTTFIRMWEAKLENEGFQYVHVNAWESDFTKDPFLSLISEIDEQLKAKTIPEEYRSELQTHWENTKEKWAQVVKQLAPFVVRVATGGLIDPDSFLGEATADLTFDLAKEYIKQYEAEKTAIGQFRARLEEFVRVYADATSGQAKEKEKCLIVFVDELDRCRPTYAVELLERVKHLFSVKGLVFILALDKEQIGHSIKSIYGSGFDTDGYLRRFIDFEYRFPDPSPVEYSRFLCEQFEISKLLQRTSFGTGDTANWIAEMSGGLASVLHLSLRVQEQNFAALSVILATTSQGDRYELIFLVALLALKAGKNEIYRGIIERQKITDRVVQMLEGSKEGRAFRETPMGNYFEAYILKMTFQYDPVALKIVEDYERLYEGNQKTSPSSRGRWYHVHRYLKGNELQVDVERLARKIDISGRFHS